MEAIGEAIKIFLEKHLIPTAISLVGGTAIYLLTPQNNWITDKITENGFWAFLCGCIFVIIESIVCFTKWITLYKYNKRIVDNAKQREKDKHYKKMEMLWDFVDSLYEDDRELLMKFIENKNEPIIFRNSILIGKLFGSDTYICKQSGVDERGLYEKCVLKESFYQDLKKSYELYGRIGHFKE